MDAGEALSLIAAFDATVEASQALRGGLDAALVAAGRTICEQVADVLESGSAMDRTKALYLLPHLVNILREMEATPKSRSEKGSEPVGGAKGGTAARRARAAQRRSGAGTT